MPQRSVEQTGLLGKWKPRGTVNVTAFWVVATGLASGNLCRSLVEG